MTFLIKSLVIGPKLLVHGVGVEDGTIHNLEITVSDYANDSALEDYDNLFKQLSNLISLFKIQIVHKLFPEGTKEGYQQSTATQQPSPRAEPYQPARYDPNNDPLRVPNSGRNPRQPISPLMEPGPYGQPYQPPFSIGRNDLNPFPNSTPFGGPEFGGNLMGPHHPGFGPASYPYAHGPNGRGRGRGVPPGARFDPFGPPGSNMGDPDRDDFGPPGANYDYFL